MLLTRIAGLLATFQESGNADLPIAVINAVGAIVAATIGALIVAYHREIKGVFTRKAHRPVDYMGEWNCNWTFSASTTGVQQDPIDDVVTLKRNVRGRIEGHGSNSEYGRYVLSGDESDFGITLSYRGSAATHNLVGVVLLEKSPVATRLEGHWWQLPRRGDMIGGATTWTKRH